MLLLIAAVAMSQPGWLASGPGLTVSFLGAIVGATVLTLGVGLFVFGARDQRSIGASGGGLLAGRYTAGYELGRGMNARTVQVQDSQHPDLALCAKLLLTPQDEATISLDSFTRHLARFRAEMRNLEQLRGCRCVVPAHSFHPNSVPPFFVMKLCAKSLAEDVRRAPIDMQQVLDVLADVCEGLNASHERDIIHRDLKPANILYYDGHWVVADFGMSMLGGMPPVASDGGSLAGTLPYTAPEVVYWPSRLPTRAADIFSLGITLKQMLTAQSTWEGDPSSLLPRGSDSQTVAETQEFDDVVRDMTAWPPRDRLDSVSASAGRLKAAFEAVNRMRQAGGYTGARSPLGDVDRLDPAHFAP